MKRLFACLPFVFATAAFAECPEVADTSAQQSILLERAQAAPNDSDARAVSQGLWALWTMAPDAKAQELLDAGMRARESWDFATAMDAFDSLTSYCPDYAEGYNQRAFVNFLRQEYDAALADLDLAIARSPTHVAAISGKALTLMGLGRQDDAQRVLKEALALNPWIPERRYLIEPPGQEL